MDFSDFRKNSDWLAKEDFLEPRILTIMAATTRLMPDGKAKPVLFFSETGIEAGMGLNKTNLTTLNRLFGSDEGDDWVGRKVEVFNDLSVSFQGQIGGLRLRAPPPPPPQPVAAPVQPVPAIQHHAVREDDIAAGGY